MLDKLMENSILFYGIILIEIKLFKGGKNNETGTSQN